MSNSLSCLETLTKLIGFEKTNNGEKITLPDEVEIDSLIMVRDWLIQMKDSVGLGDNYERKDNRDAKSLWSCNYCTYDNPVDSETCQICGLPAEVCMF